MATETKIETAASQLLREEGVFPSNPVLEQALGTSFPVFKKLMETIATDAMRLEAQWNWYKDGKSWLCKITDRKKTVAWLSAWDGYFKVGFYFTEKHDEGIAALAVDPQIKAAYKDGKPIGRLKPMTFSIHDASQLDDLLKVIEFKKSLK